jgi:CheY-like chemotaxis protein
MERHEGKIEVESVLGQGTLMRLIFPVRKLANEKKSDDDFETVLNPLRILCIDDEPLLRELLKELLHRDGHSVEIADNGQTGVNLFRASAAQGEPFDVVITDLGMPYFDGRQVAKVVKRESPLTPVIMLTGWGAFMKEDGEKPAQVDGVISKPPRSEDIRQALRKLVYDQDGFAKKSACQETPATLAV